MSNVITYYFKCLGCGRKGMATYKTPTPCFDCGGKLEFEMRVPQGTDEAPNKKKDLNER